MSRIRVTLPTRAVVAVAATALTAAAAVSAAPKPKLDATKLSISNRVVAHGEHNVDAITGVLSSDHTGLTGETVALEARTGVAPRWKVVAIGTTGTSGAITFNVTGNTKTQFKYVFAGEGSYRASHSNVITLKRIR
jgi:hypothetical protein